MGVGQVALGFLIILILIWIIVPDPIPIIDEIILIPVVGILLAKLGDDM